MRTLLVFLAAASACLADDPNPQEIIQKFAAKESKFLRARENYTYRQTVKIQELDLDGNPTGAKYELTEDVIFGPDGKRTEKVVYAPPNTLRNLILTPEDEQDLRNVQPFVLNAESIDKYVVQFMGKQQIDEISCYVFSVKPKSMVKGERYFEGQIWVDDRDLQIVKTYGKGVGILKKNSDNQFPKFETYREQIDGKYWFPTFTTANDTLHFKDMNQRIKMTVRYQDYKQFKSDVNIQFGDEVNDPGQKPGAPQKPPPPK